MDPSAMGAGLMKDPKFMELFQRALGDGKIPDENDPNREAWLKQMQQKLSEETHKEAKKQLEQPVSDKDGQWMYIVPEPGFCIKCSTTKGGKIFINLCKHERIAEPIPLEPEEQEDDAIKFKIPLSCGQAREDKDKNGSPCRVYDVIVNPNTIKRCTEDNDFRRFVAALCMTWIKQKSEPHLNADEFKSLNFRCKGVPEAQRIRLSANPTPANAMGDEIKLPSTKSNATAPAPAGGRGKLVQEMTPPTAAKTAAAAKPEPSYQISNEGSYDWTAHAKPARHPNFRDSPPRCFNVVITIPGLQTIREVDVQVVRGRSLELTYVDQIDEPSGKPFLTIPLAFHVDEEPQSAKFIKAKSELRLVLQVRLPDETDQSAKTKPSRDATEIEEEERLQAEKQAEARMQEQRERLDRIKKHEDDIMSQRKEYVESLSAVQQGAIPPVIQAELDGLPKEQQQSMILRIEQRILRGDSVDQMIEKLPPDVLASICSYLRGKLGLEDPNAKKKKDSACSSGACDKNCKDSKGTANAEKSTWEKQLDDPSELASVEYNFAKKAEKLFGVTMNNRYLFALDH